MMVPSIGDMSERQDAVPRIATAVSLPVQRETVDTERMKPGDFYVSVTDLFAVLLPGAVFAFMGIEILSRSDVAIPPGHTLAHLLALQGTAGWLAFGAISYIAGHFIASLGARLDVLYDARRGAHGDPDLLDHADAIRLRYTTAVRTQLSADVQTVVDARRAKTPGARTYRPFAWIVNLLLLGAPWPTENKGASITNAYKLARTTLTRKAPALYAEMLRTEADSKFFRSFVVVGVFALLACLFELGSDIYQVVRNYDWLTIRPMIFGVVYVVVVLYVLRMAFARFCELRLKATEMAFQGMIALAHDAGSDEVPETKRDDD